MRESLRFVLVTLQSTLREITIECENRSSSGVADQNCIEENINNFFRVGGAIFKPRRRNE